MVHGSVEGTQASGGDWVDAHSHIWTRELKKYPLRGEQTEADLKPASFTAEELLETAGKVGVQKVVLIQHYPYHGWDNSYLIDSAGKYPDRFRVVGMLDETRSDLATQMKAWLKQRVTGFRITPNGQPDRWLKTDGMQVMWKTAAETRQNMCCLINPSDLVAVDQMCEKYPDTPVVIDHFARVGMAAGIQPADVSSLCRLARHRHVTLKASAYYALGKKSPPYDDLLPMLREVLNAFGAERVMWASDAPYQTEGVNSYQASIELITKRADF